MDFEPMSGLDNPTTDELEKLEPAVQHGTQILDQLDQTLATVTDHSHGWPPETVELVQSYRDHIASVRIPPTKLRTVIGVVGDTGAGKSSIINAILDEDRLVPTNCMRACTSVATELSWNDSEDEARKYRATIEFIAPEDWAKEMSVLFNETLDASGKRFSSEVYIEGSEASITYAKLRAVYPEKSREELAKSSVEELTSEQAIASVLGTVKEIEQSQPDVFYKCLQQFMDSKEKFKGKKGVNTKAKPALEREFWPLIKVVKICVRSDVLSTGAVLVDLPGAQDSNAARATVAKHYMKQCSGLWIVAPITRAVDDKAAKSLLGTSFRRQLKYDGTYSAVTFICSKTDDISIAEAIDSLNLADEAAQIKDEKTCIGNETSQLTRNLNDLKQAYTKYQQMREDTDDKIEVWNELLQKIAAGETVHAPSTRSRKRKHNQVDSDSEESVSELAPDTFDQIDGSRPEILTKEAVEARITELKSDKEWARLERNARKAQVQTTEAMLKSYAGKEDALDAKLSAICIACRNEYSKAAIKADFAAGIREIDQEKASEENPDIFNPDEDGRDYEEVARSLPVYCASSRAFQKLSGIMIEDKAVPGFTSPEETEIPALKAHCKNLTGASRASLYRAFLNSFNQLRTSVSLWASDDSAGVRLTETQKFAEQAVLKDQLQVLEKALVTCATRSIGHMSSTLEKKLYKHFPRAIAAAIEAAIPTNDHWGVHRDQGGLPYPTYKATVCRDGVFDGAYGLQDFNAQLSEPIYKSLAPYWERYFQTTMPHILRCLATDSEVHFRYFHEQLEAHAWKKRESVTKLEVLINQRKTFVGVLKDLAERMVEVVSEHQREANRVFASSVNASMLPAYTKCAAESGAGCYMRMKDHMHNHVTAQRDVMFTTATQAVRAKLTSLCKMIEKDSLNSMAKVFADVRRDYMCIIADRHITEAEKGLRQAVASILAQSEEVSMSESIVEDMPAEVAGRPEADMDLS